MIIALNVNRLNVPTKRHRLNRYKNETHIYILSRREFHIRPRDTYRLKVKRWEKVFHPNRNQKKAGITIPISDKIDFNIKT